MDLTATLLIEICNEVCVEPELQPITGETLTGETSNAQDGARLPMASGGDRFEKTYFDVRRSVSISKESEKLSMRPSLPLSSQPLGNGQ